MRRARSASILRVGHRCELLASFSDALRRRFTPANRILVTVPLAEDLYIDADAEEHLCLPATMREDIERQALGFFKNEARYRDLGIPYRRGCFLWVRRVAARP